MLAEEMLQQDHELLPLWARSWRRGCCSWRRGSCSWRALRLLRGALPRTALEIVLEVVDHEVLRSSGLVTSGWCYPKANEAADQHIGVEP